MTLPSSNTYPEVALIQQRLQASGIKDVPKALKDSLSAFPISEATSPGDTVAVAVGSRKIKHIDTIVYHCIDYLKKNRLEPFIVPAMGSHGGATPAGQTAVLKKLGVTESSMGAPVVADMDVECIEEFPNGLNIYFSKSALTADHVVAINRIKPHTKFKSDIESGLCKMLVIGLGKAKGAVEFHRCAVRQSFKIIEQAAKRVTTPMGFLFGVALLEDGYGDVSHIETVPSSALISREKELLKKASVMMGRIPFDSLDILIIDRFGKDISGVGMDPNITGRHRDLTGDRYASPYAKRIFVRDLSAGSDGNGNGIGLADVTTHRLVNALDIEKTYINSITAISPEKASIPMHFKDDRTCLDVCFKASGLDTIENARMARIKDTMHLETIQVSRALENEIRSNAALKQIMPWAPLSFDKHGNLPPLNPVD